MNEKVPGQIIEDSNEILGQQQGLLPEGVSEEFGKRRGQVNEILDLSNQGEV